MKPDIKAPGGLDAVNLALDFPQAPPFKDGVIDSPSEQWHRQAATPPMLAPPPDIARRPKARSGDRHPPGGPGSSYPIVRIG